MPRIGLFGGTFDPVHLAHLRTAEEVREALDLDRIEMVLSASPPHKAPGSQATVAHRRRMLELALADAPRFALNLCEVEREGPSYSIDTIRAVQVREPDAEITFILGADAFAEIGTWKAYADLFTLCDFCVISRPGSRERELPIAVENAFCYEPNRGVYVHRSGRVLRYLPVTALMISASDIRRRCAAGHSIRYLVPDAVADYVATHALYLGGTADC
ncbi:MAG: nicotinate-nucleotide adenylyltransferase [Candidatus Binatia bacterium]